MFQKGDLVKYTGKNFSVCTKNQKKGGCPIKVAENHSSCDDCDFYITVKPNEEYEVSEMVKAELPIHGHGCICKHCTQVDTLKFVDLGTATIPASDFVKADGVTEPKSELPKLPELPTENQPEIPVVEIPKKRGRPKKNVVDGVLTTQTTEKSKKEKPQDVRMSNQLIAESISQIDKEIERLTNNKVELETWIEATVDAEVEHIVKRCDIKLEIAEME